MELETLSEKLPPEFGRAVEVLRSIREQEEDYYRYLSRLDYLRTQATIEGQARRTKAKLEAAEKALEAERQENARNKQALEAERQESARKDQALEAERQESALKDQALEAERLERQKLQALLLQAGIVP